jgi:hypothetical protein
VEPSIRGHGSPILSDDPAGRPSARTVLVRSDFMIGFRIGCHTVDDALVGIVITALHAMAVPRKHLFYAFLAFRFCTVVGKISVGKNFTSQILPAHFARSERRRRCARQGGRRAFGFSGCPSKEQIS